MQDLEKNHSKKNSREEAGDTKSELIRAAKKLFSQKGYDGTSVKELADEAGVNVSMVSYFFNGKEGLYRACLMEFGTYMLQFTQRVLQSPKSKEEVRIRLQMLFEEVLNVHVLQPELTTILHRECGLDFPVAQEVFRESFLKVFQLLVAFLQAAQKESLVDKNLDPLITANIHFGGLTNAARTDKLAQQYLGVSFRDKKYRENFLRHMMDSVYRNLGVME